MPLEPEGPISGEPPFPERGPKALGPRIGETGGPIQLPRTIGEGCICIDDPVLVVGVAPRIDYLREVSFQVAVGVDVVGPVIVSDARVIQAFRNMPGGWGGGQSKSPWFREISLRIPTK